MVMDKKGQIAISSGAVIVIIIILLLLPLTKVNYISFSISPNQISEPSYDLVKKSVLSRVLESFGATSSRGAYDVELFVYDLNSCPNYERYRDARYRDDCEILFQKKFTSLTVGTYYEKINYEINSGVEIYIILKRAGEDYILNENYARIPNG